jgi:hypothetical protein
MGPRGARSKHSCPGMGDARLAVLSRVTRERIIYRSAQIRAQNSLEIPQRVSCIRLKINENMVPGRGT